MNRRIISLLAIFLMLSGISNAASNYSFTTPTVTDTSNYLKGQVIYVPQGAVAQVVLSNPLSSETAYLGSEVVGTFVEPFSYEGKVIAPKGSVIRGSVIIAKKAGMANHNGEIMVRFTSITTPQNYDIAISGIIKTDDNTGILKGGTKMDAAKDYAVNTGVGAASGAVLGTALGALAGGSVGKGAVYGTAIGAGLGLAKGVADKGEAVEIPANAVIQVYFNQPITIAAPQGSY